MVHDPATAAYITKRRQQGKSTRDAIRCLKLGLDRGLKGTLVAPSSYFMKSPPIQIHDDIAFNRVEAFIRGEDNETLVALDVETVNQKGEVVVSGTATAALPS